MPFPSGPPWRTPDVWKISFSAFFADLGYQAVLALFPLYLVLELGAPIWLFGISQALAYGPGALWGYLGGLLGDRWGRRGVAILGNAFIPLLGLIGLARTPDLAIALFILGWWARNFRTPPRRALLAESVTSEHRGEAFGFLHALDVGGGMLAAAYAFLLLLGGFPERWILLLTILPLIFSTMFLVGVRGGRSPVRADPDSPATKLPSRARPPRSSSQWILGGIFSATLLYGFASYSLGFPVLTTALGTGDVALGVLVFLVFLGTSSFTGLRIGKVRRHRVLLLALGGYLVAALGSAAIALSVVEGLGVGGYLFGAGLLGIALGVIETHEPTLVAHLTPSDRTSRSFGVLTGSRSLGLFGANLALGILYLANPWYPYVYAALGAVAAAGILVAVGARTGDSGDLPPSAPS